MIKKLTDHKQLRTDYDNLCEMLRLKDQMAQEFDDVNVAVLQSSNRSWVTKKVNKYNQYEPHDLWLEYLEHVCFHLNNQLESLIVQTWHCFSKSERSVLNTFLDYHRSWKQAHLNWFFGTNPTYNFRSPRGNFPEELESVITDKHHQLQNKLFERIYNSKLLKQK